MYVNRYDDEAEKKWTRIHMVKAIEPRFIYLIDLVKWILPIDIYHDMCTIDKCAQV